MILSIATLFAFSSSAAFADARDYNYAKSGDTQPTFLSAWEILQSVTGENISEIEKKYLANSQLSLSYSRSISVADVCVDYDGENLKVEVLPFVYTGSNGETVEWIPYSVNDVLLVESNGKYYSTMSVRGYTSDTVDVKFVAKLPVSSSDVNEILNAAYNYAESVSGKIAEEQARYDEEYSAYESETEKYNRYVSDYKKFLSDYEIYSKYEVELKEWQKANDAYQSYLVKISDYEKQLSDYRDYLEKLERYNVNYQKYREYLSALETYREELEAYYSQDFTTEQRTAMYQLEVLGYIVKPVTSLRRTLSGAITGSSVTQVLAEKESLVTVGGVEARAVDLASNATDELRQLITKYKACKSDAEKYAFYILSKDDLSRNFNDLLCALDFIYQNPDYGLIRKIMAEKDRTEQFEILLAQLYYICNALTENPIPNYITRFKGSNKPNAGYFDSSYTIGQTTTRTPAEIVGENGILVDESNSEPLENGYPDMSAKPIAPKTVAEPTRPTEISEPIEPTEVDPPSDKPETVEKPVEPEKVELPEEPVAYEPTDDETAYKNAYDDGVLTERDPFSGIVFVTVESVITKYFRNAKTVTVRFYDGINEDPSFVVENAELGGYLEYGGILPTKTRKGYTCVFVGWQDSDGEKIDCNKLDTDKTDLNLYPIFAETPNEYPIIWEVDGIEKAANYAYDTSPVYDEDTLGELKKVRSGVRQYRFIGWQSDGVFYDAERSLPTVDGNAKKYVAVFEESYLVTWIIDGIGVSYPYWKGEVPDYGELPAKKGDAYKYYVFEKWDNPVVAVTSDVSYNAVFETVYFVYSNRGALKIEPRENEIFVDASFSIGSLSVRGLFEKAGSEGVKVVIELPDSTIVFSADETENLRKREIDSLSVTITRISETTYSFACVFEDVYGNSLDARSTAELSARGVTVSTNSYLKSVSEGKQNEEDFSFVDSVLSFTARSGVLYTLRPLYKVNIVKSDGVEYGVNKTAYEKGEIVEIEIKKLPEGQFVKSIYAVTVSGVDLSVVDSSFEMPDGSVTIGLILDKKSFLISFVANGKVLFSQSYKYGEKVTPPVIPDYIGETGYSYVFAGWDKEITLAFADCEYVAVFDKVEISDNSVKPVPKYTNMLKGIAIGVPVGVAVILAITITIIAVKNKKKKSKDDESRDAS